MELKEKQYTSLLFTWTTPKKISGFFSTAGALCFLLHLEAEELLGFRKEVIFDEWNNRKYSR